MRRVGNASILPIIYGPPQTVYVGPTAIPYASTMSTSPYGSSFMTGGVQPHNGTVQIPFHPPVVTTGPKSPTGCALSGGVCGGIPVSSSPVGSPIRSPPLMKFNSYCRHRAWNRLPMKENGKKTKSEDVEWHSIDSEWWYGAGSFRNFFFKIQRNFFFLEKIWGAPALR